MAKARKIYTLRCHKYSRIPINNKGCIDALQLITHNSLSALASIRILKCIGLTPPGISCLLAGILYTQFIQPKLKYSLTVSALTENKKRLHSNDLRGHPRSETKIMLHLTHLSAMIERATTLQSKFFILPPQADISPYDLKQAIRQYLQDSLSDTYNSLTGTLRLSVCHFYGAQLPGKSKVVAFADHLVGFLMDARNPAVIAIPITTSSSAMLFAVFTCFIIYTFPSNSALIH
ncbi:hypothetical protein INT45_006404 [Circinella minor]|uniref:Uncharacterized protein n=1 Tax=Circinella minor TaxID=1195481 RepID=A0A8H7SCX1_9FUNG|nr:hypothetical protein INT45_006404 [Circinella minor]